MLYFAASSVLTLAVGAMGEVLDYRICVTLCAVVTAVTCWSTIWRDRRAIRQIYETQQEET